jgi:DNA-binding MarR family transcriptional regulator
VSQPSAERVECIGDALDHASDLTVRYLNDRTGLSTTAAFVLNRLSRGGPSRLTALAAREGVSQPSMTQLVQRLERQGLVARREDPEDGRVALMMVSDAGHALLKDRKGARRDRLAELLETLTPEEIRALWLAAEVALPILQRLIECADESDRDGETSQLD